MPCDEAEEQGEGGAGTGVPSSRKYVSPSSCGGGILWVGVLAWSSKIILGPGGTRGRVEDSTRHRRRQAEDDDLLAGGGVR